MKTNYFEKLAKLYEYPYSHGSDRTLADIYSDQDPYFVQTLASASGIQPMHFSCAETKLLVCRCDRVKPFHSKEELVGFQSIADYLDKTVLKGSGPRHDRRAVHRVSGALTC